LVQFQARQSPFWRIGDRRHRIVSFGSFINSMTPAPSKGPRRLILAFKWGGCFTALVFALGGLLLDVASAGEVYEVLSRGSWFIVAISMALGFVGVLLDRSDEVPKS